MPLRDATVQQCNGIAPDRGAQWAPSRTWIAPVDMGTALAAKTGPEEIAIPAYASAGRWVVACPDCNGAQYACRTDLRFMCNECANVAVSGLWRPVTWPAEVADVEAVLEVRPLGNQNWLPDEAVADLVTENVANGLPAVLDELVPDPPIIAALPVNALARKAV